MLKLKVAKSDRQVLQRLLITLKPFQYRFGVKREVLSRVVKIIDPLDANTMAWRPDASQDGKRELVGSGS